VNTNNINQPPWQHEHSFGQDRRKPGEMHKNNEHHKEADGPSTSHHHDGREHDHNLRAAYLHVLADALTSLLAIAALLAGKYLGLNWLDPVMETIRRAQRDGLRTIQYGKLKYCMGRDVLEWFSEHADQKVEI